MFRRSTLVATPFLVLFLFGLGACNTTPAEEAPARGPTDRDFSALSAEERMAIVMRHMEVGAPAEEHALLARCAGTFDHTTRFWTAAGAEPQTLTGTTTCELGLGGRFLMCRSTVVFGGTEFESWSLLGFDRRADEFTVVHLDSTGTYFFEARGPLSEDGSQAVLHGEDADPIGEGTQTFDFVLRFVDDDTWGLDIHFGNNFFAADGKPFQMTETTHHRVTG